MNASGPRRWFALAVLALPAAPHARAADDAALAELGGAQITAGALRAQWDALRIPDEAVLEALLASVVSSEQVEDPAAMRVGLADAVRRLAEDRLLWESLEPGSEETARAATAALDWFVERHRGHLIRARMEAESLRPPGEWTEALEERRVALSIPERRTARLIVVTGERHRERAEALLGRIGAGESLSDLAAEHSNGPGWSQGGLVGPWRRSEAPWPELAEAIFSTEPSDGARVVSQDALSIVLQVERVHEGREATREEAWEAAQASARLERAEAEIRQGIESLLQRWDASDDPWRRATMRVPDPKAADALAAAGAESGDGGQALVRLLAEAHLIHGHFGGGPEGRDRWLACLGAAARGEIRGRLAGSVEPSGEAVAAIAQEIAESQRGRTPERRQFAVIRIMPSPMDGPFDPEALSRWRRLDRVAQSVSASLEAALAEGASLERAVRALDAAVEEKVEMRMLEPRPTAPTFLPQAEFQRMAPGDLSPVIAAREDVRLIYALVGIEPAQLVSAEWIMAQAEQTARSQAAAAALEEMTTDLLERVDFTLLIPE